MLEKIQFFICLFAALVVTIVSILQEAPLVVIVLRLVCFIIFFYFIGLLTRYYLKKQVFALKGENVEIPEPLPDDGNATYETFQEDNNK